MFFVPTKSSLSIIWDYNLNNAIIELSLSLLDQKIVDGCLATLLSVLYRMIERGEKGKEGAKYTLGWT